MIELFVKRWEANKEAIRAHFRDKWPEDYKAIISTVIEHLKDEDGGWHDNPDPRRIHEIDDGDYQGCLVYVIGAAGYQPSTYWYVRIDYGSCSGCDTLQAISPYTDDPSSDDALDQLMTLALHVVQRLKQMDGETV